MYFRLASSQLGLQVWTWYTDLTRWTADTVNLVFGAQSAASNNAVVAPNPHCR